MADLTGLARWIIIAGLLLVALGGLLWLFGRAGLPFGRLPGDIRIERDGFSCFFPLASMIILSALLTLALNLFARFFNN